MIASKKHNHCLREFDKFLLILHLPCADFSAHGRHIEDERQTLGYLILKIWTIFKSTQMAGNGAHADVYIAVLKTVPYTQKRELFTCYS